MAQTWLITGPAGVGKRTAARLLVAAQWCGRPQDRGMPCGDCDACARVLAGTHPDLHWMDDRGRLGVGEARVLARAAAVCPAGSLSAFVLEACERLTPPAAAALLKTLEDPPGQALFLLLTPQADQLEPTLRSRCQLLRLRPLPVGALAEWLQSRPGTTVGPEDARRLAHAAGGVVGEALRLAGEPPGALAAAAGLAEALTDALCADGVAAAVRAAGRLADLKADLETVLAVLRDVMALQHGALVASGGGVGALPEPALARLARAWSAPTLASACVACHDAIDASRFNVNALLNWERLVLALRALRGA